MDTRWSNVPSLREVWPQLYVLSHQKDSRKGKLKFWTSRQTLLSAVQPRTVWYSSSLFFVKSAIVSAMTWPRAGSRLCDLSLLKLAGPQVCSMVKLHNVSQTMKQRIQAPRDSAVMGNRRIMHAAQFMCLSWYTTSMICWAPGASRKSFSSELLAKLAKRLERWFSKLQKMKTFPSRPTTSHLFSNLLGIDTVQLCFTVWQPMTGLFMLLLHRASAALESSLLATADLSSLLPRNALDHRGERLTALLRVIDSENSQITNSRRSNEEKLVSRTNLSQTWIRASSLVLAVPHWENPEVNMKFNWQAQNRN